MRRSQLPAIALMALGLALAATAAAAAAPNKPTPALPDIPVAGAPPGRLGLRVLEIGEALRRHYGAPADRGVLIEGVEPGSAAQAAGVRVGDVLVEVAGAPVASARDVLGAIGDKKKGDAVPLVVARGGKTSRLSAKMAADGGGRDAAQYAFGVPPSSWGGDPWMRAWPGVGGPGVAALEQRIAELEKRLEKLEKR